MNFSNTIRPLGGQVHVKLLPGAGLLKHSLHVLAFAESVQFIHPGDKGHLILHSPVSNIYPKGH
jgi:hypothetical protein